MKPELRFLKHSEMRAKNGNIIVGYGAIFNSDSEDMGFVEQVKPGAFARSIREGDCRCLLNHDANKLLGRQSNGTLRLTEDKYGLRFECTIPDNSIGLDCYESVARGDLTGCSFSFTNPTEIWSKDGTRRELLDLTLIDTGPVVFPAYEGTSVQARSHKERYSSTRSYTFVRASSSQIYISEELQDERRLLQAQILTEQIRLDRK